MDDLLTEFLAETREMLGSISGAIVAWEADPSNRELLDSIFRFVHTVKGNCGFFDFPRLASLSHAAEGALGEVRAGRRQADPRLVTAVLAIIDRIAAMVDAIEADEEFPEGGDERLIVALDAGSDAVIDLPVKTDAEELGDGTAPARTSVNSGAARSIRLPVELLDRVMNGVSDMVLARNDLARRLRATEAASALESPFERLSGILAEVRESISQMRMHRIDHLYQSLPRLVRDLANELGKQVMIDFEGGDVEIDREIMEMIRDPMTHLLRNAIDHGLETPSQRIAAGKREIGMLTISARHSGNQIRVSVTDDGRGLDVDRIVAKAIENGLVTRAQADAMSEKQKLALIFAPGLSTADTISEISGRGVGMDVVRSNLERVGGSISVTSELGKRTTFDLQIPLTLSIVAGLTVSAGEQQFAIPQSYVLEIVRRKSANLRLTKMGDSRLVELRGKRIAYLSLAEVLGLEEAGDNDTICNTIIMLSAGSSEQFALGVDAIFDYEDLVVKPLAPAVMEAGFYAGTTLLENGLPILMLDVREIAAKSELASGNAALAAAGEDAHSEAEARRAPSLMIYRSMEGVKCAVRLPVIRRVETLKRADFDCHGEVPLVVLGDRLFPCLGISDPSKLGEQVRALRLSDGNSELLYAVKELIDTAELTSHVEPQGDSRFEGTVLIGGEAVRLLDVHGLFARHAAKMKQTDTDRPLCYLPDTDWSQTILMPLVEAAGYRISADPDAADVAILTEDTETHGAAARRIIRLRSEAQQGEAADETIYRYDKDALLAALLSAAKGAA
ncbi:chemotaxis protein CheA [Qipengyuania atrilutea]|uniref:Chemotaxis protein CheA n=1 Tax=Qipengyuania atrilutea TaxID=2744473 RepID=A0A850H2Z9_9SPHN|nr:chemotaxis protein CheA [Actirhodobacter atriluteus]NVD44947.1 chemotaxis protein CheA [Actirhodobacter atriluteus]